MTDGLGHRGRCRFGHGLAILRALLCLVFVIVLFLVVLILVCGFLFVCLTGGLGHVALYHGLAVLHDVEGVTLCLGGLLHCVGIHGFWLLGVHVAAATAGEEYC